MLTKNIAEVFPAVWYPKQGERKNGVQIKVEIASTLSKRNEQPIQNLRVSTKGTAVRTTFNLPYKENDEVEFLGFYWTVSEVVIDLSAISPQAVALGDSMKNAVYELTLIATNRTPEAMRGKEYGR